MKIASLTDYNFSDERLKRESARDFICQFLDSSQVDLVMECAYELNLTTEQATAYALAMFNAIQDLWYFHFNLKLGKITVTCTRSSTNIKDRDMMFRFRYYMAEPYFKTRTVRLHQILAYLKRESSKESRLEDSFHIKVKNPVVYEKKKATLKKKKMRGYKKKYRKKLKRIKKRKNRNREWMLMP